MQIYAARGLLFTFSPIARKLNFNPNPLQETEENLSETSHCVNTKSYMYHSLRL